MKRALWWLADCLPRFLHRWYADACGYFWLPCPLCGEYTGGHEWRDIDGKVSHIPDPESPGLLKGICPDCTRAGRGRDDEVCANDRPPTDYGPAFHSIREAHDAGEHAFCGDGLPGDIGLGPLPSFSEPAAHHYGDNGNGISGSHTGRVEDCPGPGCGPAECGASDVITLLGKPEVYGPCVLREGHDGPMHRESGGRSWTRLPRAVVEVPTHALGLLVEVAEFVSNGSFYNTAGVEPYSDAKARRALGALDDAGLLDQFREDGA